MDFLTNNATRKKEHVRWPDETGSGVLEVVHLIESLEYGLQEEEEENISEEDLLEKEGKEEPRWENNSKGEKVARATKYAFAASLGGEAFPGKSRLEEMVREDMLKRGPIHEEVGTLEAETEVFEEFVLRQPSHVSRYKRTEKDDVHKKLAEALEELSIVRDELISANEKVGIQQKRIFEYESILKEKDNEISGYIREIEEKNRIIEFLIRRSGESENLMAMVNGRRWSDLLDTRNSLTSRRDKVHRELIDSPRSVALMGGHSRLEDLRNNTVGAPVVPVVKAAESRDSFTKSAVFSSKIGVNRLQELKHK
ncbi:hypothetical protein Gasu2_45300 [Galdieria sulphuraria]|uniref:Uncharacterized protein n=1 Tax=Galdieria sulphuraria TaxID=130081 RepID=M2W7P4_GALSU|nr:uncharacterized protein Gasu_09050 [Galdieria sulphuraria]EME31831.1 hypothetical protein Gasu_09050 [Galdieria sulphuraria]GJD10333.1 hypothetical protein Gasu2_45300 [Galdieria sulphuraria]|eukprot:XP_005708351.1 hypothetical protein Gasu_09050 [Galdieria sulphuraria]